MATISLITVVRNGVKTIRQCLESVKTQDSNVEYVVIDGGSTDGTLEVITEYSSSISKVISEPDQGIYDAMNRGLSLVSGDVVGFLNSDDFYPHPKVISRIKEVFKDKSTDSCYGDLVYVDGDNINRVIRYWRAGPYQRRKFNWGWMLPHPTFFVRRSVYDIYGKFNLSLGTAADYELILRFLFKNKISTVYIPEVLVKMRTGGVSNASVKNRLLANRMDRLAWMVNELRPYPWTLCLKPLRKVGQFFSKSA